MKLVTLIISALLAIGVTMADKGDEKKINHDAVQPFPQSNSTSPAEKALITFKPKIYIKVGCHPYPLVNAAGEVSAGLKASGPPDGDCKGSPLGSQIYARSQSGDLVHVLVYMWFFPKTNQHRFALRTAAVIITNPEHGDPKILACSIQNSSSWGYSFHYPCPAENINGQSMKIMYDQLEDEDNTVALTDAEGEFQDAVIWEHLSPAARDSLNTWNIVHYLPPAEKDSRIEDLYNRFLMDTEFVTINDENFKLTVARCMSYEDYKRITADLSPPRSP